MRPLIVPVIALWLGACSEPNPPALREIAVWAPGLEIIIDGQGGGRFSNRPDGKHGRFSLTSTQFQDFVRRLEVYRRSPKTIAGKDMREYVLRGASCKGPYVTDNGGISFRWSGAQGDQFYSVDYGCDRDRYAARNTELQAILKSLPVPAPKSLP